MSGTSTPNDLLTALLPEWQRLLLAWSASGALTAAAQEALVLQAEPEPLKRLVSQWSQGDFSGLPPIVLLPASSMSGAAGAYALSTGTIYLNTDWLATASAAQAIAVLTEELGHYLDGRLHPGDIPSDDEEKGFHFFADGGHSGALNQQVQKIPLTKAHNVRGAKS